MWLVPLVQAVALVTWLALRPAGQPDLTPLPALVACARRIAAVERAREVWVVGLGSGTDGLRDLLAANPSLRDAWIVVFEGLRAGDLTLVEGADGLSRRRARPAVVRALAGMAINSGDPLDLSARGPGSALRMVGLVRGVPCVSLVSIPRRVARPGDEPPRSAEDNATRAVQVVARLATRAL